MNVKPVLIGGTGRSGTTIMKHVLTQRPTVSRLREEFRLISDPGGIMDLFEVFTRSWTPFRGDAAWKRFVDLMNDLSLPTGTRYTRHALSRWTAPAWEESRAWLAAHFVHGESHGRWTGISEPLVYETTSYRGRGDALGETLREWLSRLFLAPYPDARWFVDDTPELLAWFGHPSLEVALDPVVVCMVRHPLDIYASHVQRRAEGRQWLAEDPISAALRVEQAMEQVLTLPEHQVYHLEDLVWDPRRIQAQLAEAGGPVIPMSDFEVVDTGRANLGRYRTLGIKERTIAMPLHGICEALGYEVEE